MSFWDELQRVDLRALRQKIEKIPSAAVETALARSARHFSDFLAFLSPAARKYLEPMAQQANRITQQRFGKVILLYAPLYLSNECTNACVYCGFNIQRKFPRTTLALQEIIAEAEYLKGWGFKHLLLVCGEAPQAVPVIRLEEVLKALQPDFSSLSLEVYPLSLPAYVQMVIAGADGLTLYQETYDSDVYAAVHPAGRKRDFLWRLEAVERAGQAGFRRLGIGALLGLNDWRSEAVALALHAEYLMKRFWKTQVTISFPRLRHTPEGFVPPAPVSDADLVQLMLALRLFLPDVGFILSTREPAHFRDQLIGLGITQMSAGSRTDPGGYLRHVAESEQFIVEDQRTPTQVAQAIWARGYEPVWKDWDQELHTRNELIPTQAHADHRKRNNQAGI